jgi:vacuolar-type H+-ATPase subunit I/STV1
MAKTINPLDNQEVNLEENEELVSLSEEMEKPTEEPEQESNETETTTSDIPDKYKDKSLEDIVRMHQEAEKLLGKQSSEVGDLRKSVDELLKVKLSEDAKSPKKEEEPELDFYDDPKGSVNKAVENSETIIQMREMIANQQKQQILKQISEKHPDYEAIIKDNNFLDWIEKSQVRTELLQRADKYDYNAADELLSNWKEIKGVVEKTESLNEKDRKLQVKAASTGGKGSGEPMSRKIYRRSEIVNLMINDPQRYQANVDLFDKAYAEGRVK